MTDLERLTETLDALNIGYGRAPSANGEGINITLEDLDNDKTVPYTGYPYFAWIFTFDAAGKIKEVGGYE